MPLRNKMYILLVMLLLPQLSVGSALLEIEGCLWVIPKDSVVRVVGINRLKVEVSWVNSVPNKWVEIIVYPEGGEPDNCVDFIGKFCLSDLVVGEKGKSSVFGKVLVSGSGKRKTVFFGFSYDELVRSFSGECVELKDE